MSVYKFAKEVPISTFDRKFLFTCNLIFKKPIILDWQIYKFFSLFEGSHNFIIEVIFYWTIWLQVCLGTSRFGHELTVIPLDYL